jgi:vacuolar-type H+-ATPase subunit E/Vma4
MTDPLAPVLGELARRASHRIDEARHEGADRADRARADAQRQVEEREQQARAAGRQAADEELARDLLVARRAAIRSVQAARRRAFDDLRIACLDAVGELRGSPRYEALEERLVETCRRALGEDCTIERDPDGRGGVRAVQGTRRIDLTLPVLVDRAIDDLGPAVEELWR